MLHPGVWRGPAPASPPAARASPPGAASPETAPEHRGPGHWALGSGPAPPVRRPPAIATPMSRPLPPDVRSSLERARELHDRAAADYAKCREFNGLLARLLDQLEDGGHRREAQRVMALPLECSPREGGHCDQSTLVGQGVRKL